MDIKLTLENQVAKIHLQGRFDFASHHGFREACNKAFEHLSKEGYNPQYGARPLKRLIQTKILTPIAGLMVGKKVMKGGGIHVDMKGEECTFNVKKGKTPFISESFVQESVTM